MESRKLDDAKAFDAEKMKKNMLFESAHMFFDLYCLEPGQAQKVHAHAGSDKIYLVLEGTGRVTIGDETADVLAGTAVIARADVPHGIANASDARLVALVAMAPRP